MDWAAVWTDRDPVVRVLDRHVPLAAVLWNGGIRGRMTWFLLGTSYVAMAIAGLAVELIFLALGLVPSTRQAIVMEPHLTLNYTTVLNVVFLALTVVLVVRFMRTGGPRMLRMMSAPPSAHGGSHQDQEVR